MVKNILLIFAANVSLLNMQDKGSLEENKTPRKSVSLLWEAFRKGQNWAFRKLFNEYYDPLYNYGCSIIASDTDVKDLLQDFFTKLWTKRWKLPSVRNVKGYLFTSFRLLIIDYLRTNTRLANYNKSLPQDPDFNISYEQELIDNETEFEIVNKLHSALNKLTSREKEAIYLRYYQAMDYKEVGRIMGLKYQSVRNLIHNALLHLREKI